MPRKPRPSYGRVVTHEASRCVFGRVAATLSRLAAADRVVTGHNTIPPPPRPFRNQRRTRGIAGSGREPNLCCDIVSRFRVFYVEARRRDQNRSAVFHTTYGALGRRRAFGTFFAFFPSDGSVLFMFVFARDDLKKKKKKHGKSCKSRRESSSVLFPTLPPSYRLPSRADVRSDLATFARVSNVLRAGRVRPSRHVHAAYGNNA